MIFSSKCLAVGLHPDLLAAHSAPPNPLDGLGCGAQRRKREQRVGNKQITATIMT